MPGSSTTTAGTSRTRAWPYAWRTPCDAARVCGAHAGGPDLLGIDWFEHAGRPVAEVRAEFGVVPKAEHAVEAGSVTAWEPGGISPFQYECGRLAAEVAGRE